jgi:hypothetical protein
MRLIMCLSLVLLLSTPCSRAQPDEEEELEFPPTPPPVFDLTRPPAQSQPSNIGNNDSTGGFFDIGGDLSRPVPTPKPTIYIPPSLRTDAPSFAPTFPEQLTRPPSTKTPTKPENGNNFFDTPDTLSRPSAPSSPAPSVYVEEQTLATETAPPSVESSISSSMFESLPSSEQFSTSTEIPSTEMPTETGTPTTVGVGDQTGAPTEAAKTNDDNAVTLESIGGSTTIPSELPVTLEPAFAPTTATPALGPATIAPTTLLPTTSSPTQSTYNSAAH